MCERSLQGMPNDIPIKYPRRESLPSNEDEPGEAGEIEKSRISPEKLESIERERYGEAKESEESGGKEKTAALEGGEPRPRELGREAERRLEQGGESAEDIEKAIEGARKKFAELKDAPPSKETNAELTRLEEDTGNEFKKLARLRGIVYAMESAKETGSDFIIDVAQGALADEQNKKPLH